MCVGYKWESLVAIYWKQLSPENCLFDNVHLSLGRVTLWKWRKCKEPLTFLCPFLGANVVRVSLLLWCGDLKALISWCLGQNHSLSPRAALGCMCVRVCLACVCEWNIGTASVTEHTSPQVRLMVRDEKEAFGLDHSQSVTHTHTHTSQRAGLKREVKSGAFSVAVITIAATSSIDPPRITDRSAHGFQTSPLGPSERWSAALYAILYTTSY